MQTSTKLSLISAGRVCPPYCFGPQVEKSLVAHCIANKSFWQQVGQLVEPAGLEDEDVRRVYKRMHAIAKDNPQFELGDLIGDQVLQAEKGAVSSSAVKDLITGMLESPPLDEATTASAVTPVIQRRRVSDVITDMITVHSQHKDLNPVVGALHDAMNIGQGTIHQGTFLDDSVFAKIDRLRHIERLSLGISDLDMETEGGLGKSQLVVWMGRAGDGKSMSLVNMAAKALVCGFNVAAGSLELEEEVWIARLLANLTGIPTNQILKGRWQEAEKRLAELKERGLGSFCTKWFPPRSTKWSECKTWLQRTRDQLDGVDLVLTDYADKILPDGRHDGTYGAMEEVYEEHRLLAVNWKCWVGTASQKKTGVKQGADVDDAADSAHKGRVTDMMIDLALHDDGHAITARVVKNRHGPSKISAEIVPDFAHGRISASDVHAMSRVLEPESTISEGW